MAMAIVSLAIWPAVQPLTASAQSGVVIDSNETKDNFPDGATFTLAFHGPAAANAKASFHYTIASEGVAVYENPTCTGASTVTCTFDLKSGSEVFLVPGDNILYYWEIDDGSGNKTDTPQATFVYDDTRFQWKSMSDANLTLWYYGASESERPVAAAGRNGGPAADRAAYRRPGHVSGQGLPLRHRAGDGARRRDQSQCARRGPGDAGRSLLAGHRRRLPRPGA